MSSRSDQGGSQRLFHSRSTSSASSSANANPLTTRQHTRNVWTSPCCPEMAGGMAAMYCRARSSAFLAVRATTDGQGCRHERGGGFGKSAGSYTRSLSRYSMLTTIGRRAFVIHESRQARHLSAGRRCRIGSELTRQMFLERLDRVAGEPAHAPEQVRPPRRGPQHVRRTRAARSLASIASRTSCAAWSASRKTCRTSRTASRRRDR